MFLCNYSVCVFYKHADTHKRGWYVFKEAKRHVCNNLNICNQNRKLSLTVLGTQKSLANQNIVAKAQCQKQFTFERSMEPLMCVFGLAHGFWIGNSHCALIRAANTDSQKPINYLLDLTGSTL